MSIVNRRCVLVILVTAVMLCIYFGDLVKNKDISRLLLKGILCPMCKQRTPSVALFNSYRNLRYSENIDVFNLTDNQVKLEVNTEPLYDVSTSCQNEVFLLVLVTSHPKNVKRRNFIRMSWGNTYATDKKLLKLPKPFKGSVFSDNYTFKLVFLIGTTMENSTRNLLLEESRSKADLVLGNFIDSYENLTMKTRFGLKWAFYECASEYILKTDDDVFVNAVWIVEWLKEAPATKFYSGRCDKNAHVIRDRQNKWYVSYEDYPHATYPEYCLGGGYVMSRDVLENILSISYGRKLFPMEDIYVAILIHELLDVPVQVETPHFDFVYGGITDKCKLKDLYLAHRVLDEDLIKHVDRVKDALISC